MNKIIVLLPANRDYSGLLEIENAAGKRIAGPFPVCGRVDEQAAQDNKNPGRNPLLPFGDTPLGEYQILQILPSGPGTPYLADEFGAHGVALLRPTLGQAALADANGRFGFFIQGGSRPRGGPLRPTQDGSLRLSDTDQRKFIRVLRQAGEINFDCNVVGTSRTAGKVASAARTPTTRSRRNAPVSLLLACGVVASTITTPIRQMALRSMLNAAATTITSSGLIILAEDHASAKTTFGDYTETFANWQSLNFTSQQMANPAISGPSAAPKKDGVPNLLKYLYDIDPDGSMSVSDRAALPVLGVDTTTHPGTTYLTLTYRQFALETGITINVQTSPDLKTWTTVTPDYSQEVGTDPNTGDPFITVGVKATSARQFIRLNVILP